MAEYLRSRRLAAVATSTFLAVVGAVVVGAQVVPVPAVVATTSIGVPLAIFAGLIPTAALAHALSPARTRVEQAAVRRVRSYDVMLAAAVVAVPAAVAVAWSLSAPAPTQAVLARTTACAAGAVLLLARHANPAASVAVAAGWLVVAASFGHVSDGRVAAWAFVVDIGVEPWHAVAAACWLLVGALAHVVGPTRTR